MAERIEVPQVSPHAAAARMEQGALLVDVREEHEWRHARVPGAVWHPMSRVQTSWQELPPGELLVICHAGARSDAVARFLAGQGRPAANVAGGILAWHAAGLPLEQ